MKKTLLTAAISTTLLFTTHTYAAFDGFYLGTQIGWGNVHQSDISLSQMNSLVADAVGNNNFSTVNFGSSGRTTGFAGRVYAGYQFNCNWASELGWSKFTNMNSRASTNAIDNNTSLPLYATASETVKTDAVDLVLKAILPLQYNFNMFAKGGVAYLMARTSENATISEPGVSVSGSGSDNQNKYYPTFGVGIAYDFTPQVEADFTWAHIQKIGGASNIANTDLVTLGLAFYPGT